MVSCALRCSGSSLVDPHVNSTTPAPPIAISELELWSQFIESLPNTSGPFSMVTEGTSRPAGWGLRAILKVRDATTVCVVVRRCTRSRVLRRENATEEQHFFELVAPIGTESATSAKLGVVGNPCAALTGTEIDHPTPAVPSQLARSQTRGKPTVTFLSSVLHRHNRGVFCCNQKF
jgi:hypothetical protein